MPSPVEQQLARKQFQAFYKQLSPEMQSLVRSDPRIAYIIGKESSYLTQYASKRNPKSGDYGWVQMRPDTAKEVGIQHDQLMDPNTSVLAASKYLKLLEQRYKLTAEQALAAYHTGPSGLKNKANATAYTAGTSKWQELLKPEVESWKPVTKTTQAPAPVRAIVPNKDPKAAPVAAQPVRVTKPTAFLEAPADPLLKTASAAFLCGYRCRMSSVQL
jgi:hypothetical protein